MTREAEHNPSEGPLSLVAIARLWWPLALSMLLMSVEGPAHSAVVARLTRPEVNLAAWGGIVYPVSLIIESPVVMLLSASTALSKDWAAYTRLRRIALTLGTLFTALHIGVAFTPLYDIVALRIIGVPNEIVEPGRIGLMIMTPWTFAIAYRRFQEGAMIRFGHTKAVGTGAVIRLSANGLTLAAGYVLNQVAGIAIPGIVVAASAVIVGVIAAALYVGLRARPIVRAQIRPAPRQSEPVTLRRFAAFYVPLALTSLISFFVSPIGSAAMSRMPEALGSLAAWPVLDGLIFMLRSPWLAYNEVVVAQLDRPGAFRALRRFAIVLGVSALFLSLVVVGTPLARLWLGDVMALPSRLASLAHQALWFTLLLPPLALLQSWYQGIIVHSRRTRGITESVVLFLVVTALVDGIGVVTQWSSGLQVSVVALVLAGLVQVGWLWYRSRSAARTLSEAASVAVSASSLSAPTS